MRSLTCTTSLLLTVGMCFSGYALADKNDLKLPLDVNVLSMPNVLATVDTTTPLDVRGSVDANIQGTVDVAVQGVVDVQTLPDVNITTMPNVNIGNAPTVFNGDHPALTSFAVRTPYENTEGTLVYIAIREFDLPSYCDNSALVLQYISAQIFSGGSEEVLMNIIVPGTFGYGGTESHFLKEFYRYGESYILSQELNFIISAGQRGYVTITRYPGTSDMRHTVTLSGYCFTP